jgi:hypothetical protein
MAEDFTMELKGEFPRIFVIHSPRGRVSDPACTVPCEEILEDQSVVEYEDFDVLKKLLESWDALYSESHAQRPQGV